MDENVDAGKHIRALPGWLHDRNIENGSGGQSGHLVAEAVDAAVRIDVDAVAQENDRGFAARINPNGSSRETRVD